MKKLKPINLILTFLLFISCGYSPLYKDLSNVNFSITLNEVSGNRKINNLIKSRLNAYNSNNAEKKYDIDINTKYTKEALNLSVNYSLSDIIKLTSGWQKELQKTNE